MKTYHVGHIVALFEAVLIFTYFLVLARLVNPVFNGPSTFYLQSSSHTSIQSKRLVQYNSLFSKKLFVQKIVRSAKLLVH